MKHHLGIWTLGCMVELCLTTEATTCMVMVSSMRRQLQVDCATKCYNKSMVLPNCRVTEARATHNKDGWSECYIENGKVPPTSMIW